MIRVDVKTDETEGSRLAELYQRHASEGIRLAYLITGDRALAEDLMQDAFVRLAPRLLHLRDPSGFEPYLRRTIVNLANAHFRRRKVERRYAEHQRGLRELSSAEPDVPEREAVWEVLRALPTRQRTAIVLRFYEDLSEAQTAEIMRCRPGTVKSLVSRGIGKLRPVMEGE
jgi:RNA polymerase sigma-70 factor (sigma-E family)